MIIIVPVIFLILYGTVHLIYAGHSKRIFQLTKGLDWPDGSRLQEMLGTDTTRLLAVLLLILADFGFTISAVGLLMGMNWWRAALPAAALFSSLIFILFWNGEAERTLEQGAPLIMINLGLIAFSLVW